MLDRNSALAELRSATGGLQAVLNQFFRLFPVFSRVSSFCLAVFPYELTHQLSRFFFTICAESLVYHRCQFPRLIVLHLGVNVHSHLAVLVPSQILNSLWIDAFMNQIRDIGVPEKMRRHMEIQSIVDALVRSASLTKLRRNGVMDFLTIRHIGNIQNLTKSLYSTVNRMDYFQAAPVLLRLCYTITPVQID